MRKSSILIVVLMLITSVACNRQEKEVFTVAEAEQALQKSAEKYKKMIPTIPDSVLPRTFQGDSLVFSNIYWWTSGFYPGTLWYLYEYSEDETLREEAHKRSMMLEPIKNVTNDHDVGFMLYCSMGNGLRITGNEIYEDMMVQGARSLATRYNPVVGSLKSWDWSNDRWEFPVIIDNMMNLELLMWASKHTGDDTLTEISIEHAYTSMENHYRDDYSSWHVVDYDPETGEVRSKVTHQGYSDESAWARGQSWGLYGYVMMYRETKEQKFLDHAVKVADFLLNHPNLPEDKIPYWDFDAPNIPYALRDASAGAIMASALLELSTFTEGEKSEEYFDNAEQMLASLASDDYFAEENSNGNFILKHSVGHLKGDSEVDVPLTYADYYFVEGLLRYIDLKKK